MTSLMAVLTGQTCGDACWHAREDICRCSCHGANHGCLRSGDGEQPARTSRVKSHMYTLYAVLADYRDGWQLAERLNQTAVKEHGIGQPYIGYDGKQNGFYPWRPGDDGAPAVRKTATESQIRAWPELASFRTDTPYYSHTAPQTLWIRSDLIDILPTAD